MMRYSALFSSLSIVAVMGACAPISQITTRANTNPLTFQSNINSDAIEDQAVALNRMADQLVWRSTARGAVSGAAVACSLAAVSVGSPESCAVSAAAGMVAGGLIGRQTGEDGVEARVELVSADALVRSIRGMNGQMDAIEITLPELMAEQDAELADLDMRRELGVVSRSEYKKAVSAITDSRARIAESLTLTVAQAEQANFNLQKAGQQGQDGLDWHLSATAQLAREADSARSLISPLSLLILSEADLVAHAPRSGVLR